MSFVNIEVAMTSKVRSGNAGGVRENLGRSTKNVVKESFRFSYDSSEMDIDYIKSADMYIFDSGVDHDALKDVGPCAAVGVGALRVPLPTRVYSIERGNDVTRLTALLELLNGNKRSAPTNECVAVVPLGSIVRSLDN